MWSADKVCRLFADFRIAIKCKYRLVFDSIRTTANTKNPHEHWIFQHSCGFSFGAREGTRTPKDKPHAPQTCASASSATLAYLLYSSPVFEVENRWCGLLGYSNIFPAIRQVVSLFLISFFMLHIYNSSAARAKAALQAIAQVICTRKVCLRRCAQSKGGVCI